MPSLLKVDLAVVFAAGRGVRMRSDVPKVLHKVAGLSMLEHVVATASLCARKVLLVLSQKLAEEMAEQGQEKLEGSSFAQSLPHVLLTVQPTQDGTGGAAACALDYAAEQGVPAKTILFLNGDAPLLSPSCLQELVHLVEQGVAPLALLGFSSETPFGYGRLLGSRLDGSSPGFVEAVREQQDCSESERAVPFCNAGVYATRLEIGDLQALLARLPALEVGRGNTFGNTFGNAFALPERRLTDLVALYEGKVAVAWAAESEALGVNSLAQLARAERLWQQRKRQECMEQGVRMLAPETVFFSHDTVVGRGTVIEPYVVFGEKVSIGEEVSIGSFCHLVGAKIAARASVGPFARLRPTSVLGEGAKVGNFVETKNATLAEGAKASHLSYLGDCSIGENANIGAGVITCNYDGKQKHHTQIGAGAFVGSNSSLIAPVAIGERACIGASSAINVDVEADTLAFERSTVTLKPLKPLKPLKSLNPTGKKNTLGKKEQQKD